MHLVNRRVFLLLLLGVIYFTTHLPRLGYDEINPDAVNWHIRSEQYIDAIKSHDFNRTYQHYHPGVTLMLITGAPIEFAKRYIVHETTYSRINYEIFHMVAKYSLNFVLLVLTYLLIFNLTKVSSFKLAYLVGLLLSIEPFFVGNARLYHMDTLLSLLVINGLITFYISITKNSKLWLILSSLYLGYAFWTKSSALIAILFCLGLSFLLFIAKKFDYKFLFNSFLIIVVFFFVAGYSILPALWTNPKRIFSKMYNSSKTVVDEGHDEKFFGVSTLDPGPFFYPVVLAFKLSPVVLVLFVISLFYFPFLFLRELKEKNLRDRGIYYFLFIFLIGYFIVFEVANKKIDRYLLPLFPIIFTLSSFTFIKLISFVKDFKFKFLIYLILITCFVYPLYSYFPYYFVYNSPLFGGNKAAEYAVGQKSFGIGVFEVRDYIIRKYGFVNVGFIDRKALSVIYPNSMVFDARVAGTRNYKILVLDSDDKAPKKTQGKFEYDGSIKIAGVNFWNFYVKKTTEQ